MAASDGHFVPLKNTAFRVTFPILDNTGSLVTGAAGLDSEVSIDGGTFTDCTNEATEIATASGMYYLDLTAAEMNGTTISVIVKTSTTNAKTTPIVLYTAARDINDLAFPATSGRSLAVATGGQVGADFSNINGTLDAAEIGAGAITLAKFGAGAIDSTVLATGAIVAGTFAADAIGAAAIATDAIGSAEIATSAAAEIAGAVWDIARSGHTTAGTFGEGQASVQGNVTGSVGSVTGAVGSIAAGGIAATSFAAGAVNAAAIATDAVGSAQVSASAVTKIASGIWDEPRTSHVAAGSFGQALQVSRASTATGGGASTITLDAGASATDNLYIGQSLLILAGTGAGQNRVIVGYVGSTKVATVDSAWATNPDATSVFIIHRAGAYVTPGALATDAVDADAIATSAVTEIQSGLATAASISAISARIPTALVDGHMDSFTAEMGTDVITSAAVAADAVVEIQSGLATAAAVAGVQSDTTNIKTRIPAALVSGRIDSNVGAMANNTVTAAAIAADADAEIADAVLDRAIAEPTGIHPWPASIRSILGWTGVLHRNKKTTINTSATSATVHYRNDADSADLATRVTTDDGVSFVAAETT